MAKKKKRSRVEAELLDGLESFAAHLQSGKPIAEGFTVRRFTLDLNPMRYRAKDVKNVRALLQTSQPLFARFLGVSVKTVRAWESGKTPSDMAARFMDEIRRDPEYWRRRISQAARRRIG